MIAAGINADGGGGGGGGGSACRPRELTPLRGHPVVYGGGHVVVVVVAYVLGSSLSLAFFLDRREEKPVSDHIELVFFVMLAYTLYLVHEYVKHFFFVLPRSAFFVFVFSVPGTYFNTMEKRHFCFGGHGHTIYVPLFPSLA